MVIKAKYPGKCKKCGEVIEVGEPINWERGSGAAHVECPDVESAPYLLGGGSGYGCRGWDAGQTIKSSERHKEQGWPEFVTVLRSSREYVREDGLSFGVGDESGHLYRAACRAATDDEVERARAKIEAAEQKKEALARVEEIKRQIMLKGERPDGERSLGGERLIDTQDVYGGGDWFIIGREYIWYIQNNGADGDDWSRNNIRICGAGAIGWRVEHTDDLDMELRELCRLIGGGAK